MTERQAHLNGAVWAVVVTVLAMGALLALIHTENATRDAQIADLNHRLAHAEALADRAVADLTGSFEMSAWMFRCVVTPDTGPRP
jgi:hypothetical protein